MEDTFKCTIAYTTISFASSDVTLLSLTLTSIFHIDTVLCRAKLPHPYHRNNTIILDVSNH
jgi:hypothetical protein